MATKTLCEGKIKNLYNAGSQYTVERYLVPSSERKLYRPATSQAPYGLKI